MPTWQNLIERTVTEAVSQRPQVLSRASSCCKLTTKGNVSEQSPHIARCALVCTG